MGKAANCFPHPTAVKPKEQIDQERKMRRDNHKINKEGSRRERGQGIVEFALTLPLLLMLLLGIMEYGRLMYTYVAVVSAAREAGRYGAAAGISTGTTRYYQDCNGIRDAAIRVGGIAGVRNTAASVNIQYDNGPGIDNITAGCPVNGTGPVLMRGDRINITVAVQFQPTQGLIDLPAMTVQSQVRRTIVVNVPVR
jgi:Flp pilus assembly protein TadG